MQKTSNISLTAENLDIFLPNKELVRNLNLELKTNEFIAILGQNGTGKSLTLHTLAGLRKPSNGKVIIESKRITELPRRSIAKTLSLVLQDHEDIFPSTVYENVLIGRHPHIGPLGNESKNDHNIVDLCLKEVNLHNFSDRNITSLSGGERRRLALAQALAQNPKIFLLDEPLNHLDPQHQIEVMKLFSKKLKHGKSIIASMHDINLVNRFADRCLLLYGNGNWKLGLTKNVLSPEILSELYEVEIKLINSNGSYFFTSV